VAGQSDYNPDISVDISVLVRAAEPRVDVVSPTLRMSCFRKRMWSVAGEEPCARGAHPPRGLANALCRSVQSDAAGAWAHALRGDDRGLPDED
jgi:hypothetical protein